MPEGNWDTSSHLVQWIRRVMRYNQPKHSLMHIHIQRLLYHFRTNIVKECMPYQMKICVCLKVNLDWLIYC